jgi:hypothetical protein
MAADWRNQHGNQAAVLPQLGLPAKSALEASGELWPEDDNLANVLRFDYTVDGPPIVEDVNGELQQKALAFRIFVLNSRTGRQFATDDWFFDTTPAWILGERTFEHQLNVEAIPESEKCELAIVVSPAPIVGVPWVENLQDFLALFGAKAFADYEYWGLQKEAVQRLFSRTAQLGREETGKRNTRAIILSGDVHYGFGAGINYGNATSDPAIEAAFAQFTASSLKNQEIKPRVVHNVGYAFWGDSLPEMDEENVDDEIDSGGCYKPRFIRMEPEAPEPPPGATPGTDLGKQMAIAQKHQFYADEWANGKETVGYNNLGEIRIEVDGSGKPTAARQILYWYSGQTLLQTVYEASLDFVDPGCD